MRYDDDLSSSEYIEANNNNRGFAESNEVCEWLSEIFGQEGVLIKADSERLTTLNKESRYILPKALEDDKRRAFVSAAAIHVINE